MREARPAGERGPLVRSLVAGTLENNVYLAACPATRQAVLIDPAADAGRILKAAAGLTVAAVLLTHGHHDHLGAAAEVSRALRLPLRLHPHDLDLWPRGLPPPLPLHDTELLHCGTMALEVRHTPGHSPGSVCFVAGGVLFSGDTLFPGGPGATSGTAAFREVMASLRERLFTLPDDTVALPGHGPATTIGAERPFLDEWQRRGW